MIIKIEPNDNGSRANQSTTPRVIPAGWIEAPAELEGAFLASSFFCTLIIEDGVLVGIEALPIPEPTADPAAEITALKTELTATDYQIIKCSEYRLAGLDMPYDLAALHEQRQELRNQINRLEEANEQIHQDNTPLGD